MLSREQRKNQTRKALMDAALMLVGQGANFASISLREVAKNAGVVPTSFYRHFTDMEELGLNLVDDLGLMLRKLMRTSRQTDSSGVSPIRSSVAVYTDFVCQHRSYFYFMMQCRTGGTPELRRAIRNELKYFANELATDIQRGPMLAKLAKIDSGDLEMITQLIVATVAETTIDILDLVDSTPSYHQELIARTEKKLRLIWLGVAQWHS